MEAHITCIDGSEEMLSTETVDELFHKVPWSVTRCLTVDKCLCLDDVKDIERRMANAWGIAL